MHIKQYMLVILFSSVSLPVYISAGDNHFDSTFDKPDSVETSDAFQSIGGN